MIRENYSLRYSSLYSYTPYKNYANVSNISYRDELDKANKLKTALKNDREIPIVLKNGREVKSENFIQYIARYIKENLNEEKFAKKFSFFGNDTLLIPIPKSSLMKEGTLWVPKRIAQELEKQGLGRYVDLLERIYPVNKSSTSLPKDRPKPEDHYNSIKVKNQLIEVGENTKFVLVDDVITRGSTLLGCANKILDVWNHADIYGFAVFRTISNHYEFKNFLDPITGIIKYRPETKDTIRE